MQTPRISQWNDQWLLFFFYNLFVKWTVTEQFTRSVIEQAIFPAKWKIFFSSQQQFIHLLVKRRHLKDLNIKQLQIESIDCIDMLFFFAFFSFKPNYYLDMIELKRKFLWHIFNYHDFSLWYFNKDSFTFAK